MELNDTRKANKTVAQNMESCELNETQLYEKSKVKLLSVFMSLEINSSRQFNLKT